MNSERIPDLTPIQRLMKAVELIDQTQPRTSEDTGKLRNAKSLIIDVLEQLSGMHQSGSLTNLKQNDKFEHEDGSGSEVHRPE